MGNKHSVNYPELALQVDTDNPVFADPETDLYNGHHREPEYVFAKNY